MTDTALQPQELRDATPSSGGPTETAPSPSVQGKGRFSRLTYGTGEPKATNVLGASNASVDWNNQTDEK